MSTIATLCNGNKTRGSAFDLSSFYTEQGAYAFSKKTPVNSTAHQNIPIAKEKVDNVWQTLLSQSLNPVKRLIYTHIPFCATHCAFCGFFQNSVKKNNTQKYTDYLLKELAQNVDSTLVQSTPIHAIYFGGGTPTALSAKQLKQIISFYKNHFPLAPDCEITIEGRILNFDEEKIEACLEAGANRFSIGIQTFDTKIRRSMGRYASKEQAITFIEKIAHYNSAAVVCDLMFGLPGQTMDSWQTDLEIVQNLPLDGIDLYAINILPNTKLAENIASQKIVAPTPEEIYNYYIVGQQALYNVGWVQLSNNHWARTTRERNLYNLLIKQGADFLAYGSGAGGRLDNYSFMLARSLEHYYAVLDEQRKPFMMLMHNQQPSWSHQLQGQAETGLIHLPHFLEQPSLLQPLINNWYQSKLITDDSFHLRMTPSGRFWGRNIYMALDNILKQIIV